MNIRRGIATVGTAGALATGSLFLASPAQAQGPIFTGGLVNVTIVDFADVNVEDVVIQLPVSVAANVCVGGVIQVDSNNNLFCDATSESRANA